MSVNSSLMALVTATQSFAETPTKLLMLATWEEPHQSDSMCVWCWCGASTAINTHFIAYTRSWFF